MRRALNLAEALAFVIFVGLYIWRLQATWPGSWLVFPVWLTASFALHRDTPKTLGWRADNLGAASSRAAVVFTCMAVALAVIGFSLHGLSRRPEHLADWHRFVGYFSFCLLQQVALNSFLMNRLLAAFENLRVAALVSATIFAALHWPNPVLVPLTFLGGCVMCWLFGRKRNILPLALGQAVLGAVVWWAFPLAWHHAMRVGPGYYAFTPR